MINPLVITYESPLGPIHVVMDPSVEPGTARIMQSWKVVHVSRETFDQIRAECVAAGLIVDKPYDFDPDPEAA